MWVTNRLMAYEISSCEDQILLLDEVIGG